MKCVNIKLSGILGCFHYILNAPRIVPLYVVLFQFISITKYKNQYFLLKLITIRVNIRVNIKNTASLFP